MTAPKGKGHIFTTKQSKEAEHHHRTLVEQMIKKYPQLSIRKEVSIEELTNGKNPYSLMKNSKSHICVHARRIVLGVSSRGVRMSSGIDSRPVRFETWRLGLIYLVVAFTLTGFVIRLVTLQILNVDQYKSRAIDNYTIDISVPAPRGIIYDRNGYILARNIAAYNVVITPANLPAEDSDILSIS